MRRLLTIAFAGLVSISAGAAADGTAEYRREIQPIRQQFCFDCHADGANKGGVAFDELKLEHGFGESRELWARALKNLRAGLMPPNKKLQPSPEQKARIAHWIKTAVFEAD